MASTKKFTFERINKDNVMLLVVDHQIGLFQLDRDFTPDEDKDNILSHAELGKIFNLPTILTTSAENGTWYKLISSSPVYTELSRCRTKWTPS